MLDHCEGGGEFVGGEFAPIDDVIGIGDEFFVCEVSVLITPAKFSAALGGHKGEDAVRFSRCFEVEMGARPVGGFRGTCTFVCGAGIKACSIALAIPRGFIRMMNDEERATIFWVLDDGVEALAEEVRGILVI